MPAFQTSLDIANRSLQHVGAPRIRAFDDDSKGASEVSFCYDKLREAELRRNIWRFSIRKAAIRPVETDTTLLAPAAYSAAVSYARGAVVTSDGQWWESQQAANLGNTPGATAGTAWELYCGPRSIRMFVLSPDETLSDVAYYAGELVLGNGDADTTTVYRSLQNDNDDIPPSTKWLSLGTVSTPLEYLYPIGAGPADDFLSRNVFLLPANYLRNAPQDPKMGNISYLGAPHYLFADDWLFQDDVIVSGMAVTIVLRFVASVTLAAKMDAMFCEGLACRIGLEICETITQSGDKLSTIANVYRQFMGEARTVNAIEQGPVESPMDDWLAARV